LIFSNRSEPPLNPGWITAAIEDGVDVDPISLDKVVDRKGKSFGKHAMKTTGNLVNAGINAQRLYVRLNRTKKVVAQANRVVLVESIALDKSC
jgi:hypothetical protein